MKDIKDLKTEISEKPFKLIGITLDEYYRWCEKNQLRPYIIKTKKEFFKRYNEFVITKRNGKIFENGVEF